MKNKLLVVLIILYVPLSAQVNMDSICHIFLNSNDYQITDTIESLSGDRVRFMSEDGSNSYDVFLDSALNLKENIGVSIIYREYDAQKRNVKRIGYSIDGYYSLWDFSPIIHTRYAGDTTVEDHFNRKYEFYERVVQIKDMKGREIEVICYDENYEEISHVTNTYNDTLGELLIINYDAKGNIKPNSFGVAIHYLQYDPEDCTRFLEEKFFNLNMALVDADHLDILDGEADDYSYSTIKRVFKDSDWTTLFYNAANELRITGYLGYYSLE